MYKFIFIDDEDLMRELFTILLDYEMYGFELQECFSSAEQALNYLKYNRDIDVIITDIKMGHMNGVEFCEKIRKLNFDIELVIMSGHRKFEYAQQAIKYNVVEYMLKPTSYNDLDKLFKKLKTTLDGKKQRHQYEVIDSEDKYHYTKSINVIKNYLHENYYKNVTLDEVAAHVAMNSSYLSRFFKKHSGYNFTDYLSIRINKAKEALQDNMLKVYEVGKMVGYKNIHHFYKIFKKLTGMTPSQFRETIEDQNI